MYSNQIISDRYQQSTLVIEQSILLLDSQSKDAVEQVGDDQLKPTLSSSGFLYPTTVPIAAVMLPYTPHFC
jgi:hypothetical protein